MVSIDTQPLSIDTQLILKMFKFQLKPNEQIDEFLSPRVLKSQTREEPNTFTKDSEGQDGEDFSLSKNRADKPLEHPFEQLLEQPHDHVTRPTFPATSPTAPKPVAVQNKEKVFVPPPYKPQLPFSGRYKKALAHKYRAFRQEHQGG